MPVESIIQSDRPCPITGATECSIVAEVAREGHPLRNVMSRASGLIYVDPLPVEDLEKFYREDYRVSYKNVIVPKPKHIYRAAGVAVERLGHSKGAIGKDDRCLDIGAGGGEWVALMQRIAGESCGIEPNTGYGSFAKDEYGVDVFIGIPVDAPFEKGSFDVVTLFQVLEHLANPVEDIRTMGKFLKPGGKLIIEVPDILFAGMRFCHKWHDGHLYGFDVRTLEAVAARAGFSLLSMTRNPGNLFAVFEKSEDEVPIPDLSNHYEEALRELTEGRAQYWKRSETWTKPATRIRKTARELLNSSQAASPAEILERVYAQMAAPSHS